MYFEYDVSTTVSIDVPLELEVTDVSACYRYTDILLYEKYNRLNGTNYTYDMTENELDKLKQGLSIADIFNYTPNETSTFENCRIKKPQRYQIFESTTECLELFKIHKYFFVEYMCYRYSYIGRPNMFLFEELANTPKLSGVMYEISPGKMFDKYQFAKFVVH